MFTTCLCQTGPSRFPMGVERRHGEARPRSVEWPDANGSRPTRPAGLTELACWRGLRRVYVLAVRGLRPPTRLGGFLGFMRLRATPGDWRGRLINARNEGVPGSSPGVGSVDLRGFLGRASYAIRRFFARGGLPNDLLEQAVEEQPAVIRAAAEAPPPRELNALSRAGAPPAARARARCRQRRPSGRAPQRRAAALPRPRPGVRPGRERPREQRTPPPAP